MSITSTIMEKYQVRKTKKQKTAFIEYMQAQFTDMRIEKCGMMGSRNLIFGDIDSADVVFTAHYDTVAENLLPNLIIPRLPWLRMLYMLLVIAPMVIVMLAVKYGMLALGASDDTSSICMLAAYLIMFVNMFFLGWPNKHTANDNTSGVIALISILQRLSPAAAGRAAFVLFDNEEYGCVGSGAFWKAHKDIMQDKLVFNMDCVGDGDNLLMVLTEKAEEACGVNLRKHFVSGDNFTVEYASAKKIKYSSDQKHFPVSIALAALHRHKVLGLWVGRIHTRRDTICRQENIDFIVEKACGFIEDT